MVGPIRADDRKFLSILPVMSGYRDKDTHKLTFTTFYDDRYGTAAMDLGSLTPLPPPLEHLCADEFITVLRSDHVVSCRIFDPVAYLEFQKTKNPLKPKKKP